MTNTPQEAALLAGRLETEGVRAMVSIGHSAPGPWAAVIGNAGAPVLFPANPMQRARRRCLWDERDLELARRVAARYAGR